MMRDRVVKDAGMRTGSAHMTLEVWAVAAAAGVVAG